MAPSNLNFKIDFFNHNTAKQIETLFYTFCFCFHHPPYPNLLCHIEYEDDDGNDNRYDDRGDDDDISHDDGREDGDYYYPPGTAIGGHSDELDDFIKRFS